MAQPIFPPDAPSFADGRFVLVARLGAGTVGSVYRGYDRKQQGWRAFKVLAPDRASDAAARGRFVRAAEAFAAIAHPNLVRVYEVGDAAQPYAVMELVTGGTVGAWIDRYGPMPAGLAAGTVLEIARGLAALHAAGVEHGHVRAHNALVTAGGVRKLGDSGLGPSTVDTTRDLRDLGRLLAGLTKDAPPALAWIAEEAGEALDTADAVADALEAILGDLPGEPPGTPDPVLDRSASEIVLRPGNHPEILALLATHKPPPGPTPAPAPAARRFVDPGDYDDEAMDAPPVPSRSRPAPAEPAPAPAAPVAPAPVEEVPPAPIVTEAVAVAEAEPTPDLAEPAEPDVDRAPVRDDPAPDGPVYVEFTDTPSLPEASPEPAPADPRRPAAAEPVWVVEEPVRSTSSVPPTPAPLGRWEDAEPAGSPAPSPVRGRSERAPVPRAAAVRPLDADASASSSPSGSAAPSAVGCLRWVLLPVAFVGLSGVLSVVLVFVVLISGILEVSGAERGTANAAEQLMTALDKSQPAVERLIAIGGDEALLHERLLEFQSRRNGPGQLDAAIALVQTVEAAGDELLGERVAVDNMNVDHQVRSLRAAHLQYDQARSNWVAASEAWRGSIAVRLGLASPPDDRWP